MTPARAARARRLDELEPRPVRRRRDHLTVVEDEPRVDPRRSRRPVVVGALGLMLVFSALLGLAVFHTVLVQTQSQIDDLDERVAREQEAIERARLEIAQLEAPDRVIAEAAAQGLIPPAEVVTLEAVTPPDPEPTSPPGGGVGPVTGHEVAGGPSDETGDTP